MRKLLFTLVRVHGQLRIKYTDPQNQNAVTAIQVDAPKKEEANGEAGQESKSGIPNVAKRKGKNKRTGKA